MFALSAEFVNCFPLQSMGHRGPLPGPSSGDWRQEAAKLLCHYLATLQSFACKSFHMGTFTSGILRAEHGSAQKERERVTAL